MNSPDLIKLAAVLRAAGCLFTEPGSTVTREATPNDALRLVEAMEKAGLQVSRP